MSATRKLNTDEVALINKRIRIVEDCKAMCILGAWIRNNTNTETPWEPILDKIQRSLEHYSNSFPTLKERKIIAQMVIGGYTQFLTKAQGMLDDIEAGLIQKLQKFLWEENTLLRITLDYLYKNLKEGGLNLLNIRAGNTVIEIVWLKVYLNLSPTRPVWAKITDIIINAAALHNHNMHLRHNMFLQTWRPQSKGNHQGKLNKDIIRMLKAAKDHNINFAPTRISKEIKLKLRVAPAQRNLKTNQQ